MRYLTIIFCAVLVILMGCATTGNNQRNQEEETRKIMNSWLGRDKSELIQSWGPPSSYDSDGKGGEILTYRSQPITIQLPYMFGRGKYGNTVFSKTVIKYRQFYVNEKGIIYYWRVGTE
jgi:hypothetical protein